MTDVAQKKDEVKKQLKALLMSAPAALTIDELKRDYKDFIGEAIPFRLLGYILLEDFLKDLQDSIHVTWKKGVMCISALHDENTAHIQRLVSKQKVSNKQKWATLRKGGPPPQRHRSQPPRPPPLVPPFIRKYIIQLLRAYPDGLPYTHFDTAFSRRFGIQINFSKLGFRTLCELLQSLPDIISLQEYGNGELRVLPAHNSYNLQQHVSYQKSHSYDSHQYSDHVQQHYTHENTHSSDKQPLQTNLLKSKHYQPNLPPRLQKLEKPCQPNFQRSVSVPETNASSSEPYRPPHLRAESVEQREYHTQQVFQQPPAPRGRGKKRSCSGSNIGGERNRHESDVSSGSLDNSSSYSGSFAMDNDSGISAALIQELQELLNYRPKGIWASRLLPEYKEQYKKALNIMDHGYTSVIQLCSALPDVIRITRPNAKGDWLLFDIRLPVETEELMTDQSSRQRHTSQEHKSADPKLKEQIRQVLQCHPKGLPLTSLPDVFEELTGTPLRWAELGFKGVETFALSLADSILQFQYKGNGLILLFAIDNGEPRKTDLLKDLPLPEPEPEQEEDALSIKIPPDAIGPGTHYTMITLPPCNQYIEIYISNVVSPGLFWFQLRGKNTSVVLEKVMNLLEYAYKSSDGNRYIVPDELVCIGMVVAAIFPEDDNWHRCVVTGLKPGNYIEVYFVDYGNTCPVHRKNIRLLKSKFLRLPGQAIQGRLSNIGPVRESWTMESRTKLLKLVTNRPLIALATSEKDSVMSLCLTDTNGKEDLHINDLLINEGYARFVPDDYTTQHGGPLDHEAVPDYNCVYGSETTSVISETTTSSTPQYKAATGGTAANQEQESVHSKHYVLQLRLTKDYVVHLVNLDGTAYLLSSEVSGFIWDVDILTSMLRQKRGEANKIKVEQACHPALFEELHQYGIQSLQGENNKVTLYELNSIPYILELFEVDSEELMTNVLQLIQSFDPEDPYWKGEDLESEVGSHPEESVEQFDVKDLQLALQLLQFKRKRILQTMMEKPVNTVDVVNELNKVENEITKLKEMLNKLPTEQVTEMSPQKQHERADDAQTDKMRTEKAAVTEPDPCQKPAKPIATVASTPIKTNVVAPLQSTAMSCQPQPSTQTSSNQSNALNQNLLNTLAQQQQLLYQSMLVSQALNANQSACNTEQQINMLNPSLAGQQNPLLNPLMPTGISGLMPGLGSANQLGQLGMMQGLGRGQASTGGNMMLLPGLLPLLNSLNIGSSENSDGQNTQQPSSSRDPS